MSTHSDQDSAWRKLAKPRVFLWYGLRLSSLGAWAIAASFCSLVRVVAGLHGVLCILESHTSVACVRSTPTSWQHVPAPDLGAEGMHVQEFPLYFFSRRLAGYTPQSMNILLLMNKTPCDQASGGQNVSLFQAFCYSHTQVYAHLYVQLVTRPFSSPHHFVHAKVYLDWSSWCRLWNVQSCSQHKIHTLSSPPPCCHKTSAHNQVPPLSSSDNVWHGFIMCDSCDDFLATKRCIAGHSSLLSNSHSLYVPARKSPPQNSK